jgi:hypothetical protein
VPKITKDEAEMGIQLLDIGSDTEQLSACHLSLLLGVNSNDNKIKSFLKFARKILGAHAAILTFSNEPYSWYAGKHAFNAFQLPAEANFATHFEGDMRLIACIAIIIIFLSR